MERTEESELVDELCRLTREKSTFARGPVTDRPYAIYRDSARFDGERNRLFRRLPHAVLHGSELPGPGSYVRASHAGVPLLLTRDEQGTARAFLNACRHRGMRLVEDVAGCSTRFTCPYHAWTYGSDGCLRAAPHFEAGFGELSREDLGLHRFDCQEYLGFLWVTLEPERDVALERFLAPVAEDLRSLDFPSLRIAQASRLRLKANWKLLIEGGLEAYHFKVAHRNTIAPYFENNLSTYRQLGDHLRSVLPRVTLADAVATGRRFPLCQHANIAYWLAPNTQFLVQQDHVVWTQTDPLSAGETALRLLTLVPESALAGESAQRHWEKNHRITLATLSEDFEIAEKVQESVASGIDQSMLFGRFESALDVFNRIIERHLR